jgi:hypothetical protein
MPMGGCHMMPVSRTLREGAGVKPGDTVVVVMERDDEVRTVAAPAVLKQALAKNKAAKGNREKLAFTYQKEMAVWIEGAKQEETRVRKLAKVMQVLETGTKWTGRCHCLGAKARFQIR